MAAYGRQYSDPDTRPADASHLYPGYQRQYRHENMRYVPEDELRATPRYYYGSGVNSPEDELEKRARSRKGSIDSLDSDRLHRRQSHSRTHSRPHSRSHSRSSYHSHRNRRRDPSPRSSRSRSPSLSGSHRFRSSVSRGRSVRGIRHSRSRSSSTGNRIVRLPDSSSRDSSFDGRRRTRRRSISSSPEDLARGGGHGGPLAMKRAHSANPTSAMMRTGAAASYYGNSHGNAATHANHPARGKNTPRKQRQRHAMEVAVGNAARAAFRVNVPEAPQRSIVQKAGKVAGVALTGYLVDYVLDRNAKKHPLKHIGVSMLQGALMDHVIDANSFGDLTKIGTSQHRSNMGHYKEAPF